MRRIRTHRCLFSDCVPHCSSHHQLQGVSAVGQRVPTEPKGGRAWKGFQAGVATRSIGPLVARRLTQGNTSKGDAKYLRRTRGLEILRAPATTGYRACGNRRVRGVHHGGPVDRLGGRTEEMFRRRQFHTKPTASDSLVGGAKTLRDTKEEENEEKEGRDRAVGFQFKEVGTLANRAKNPVVFLDVSIGGVPARLTFELRKDIVPRTAENFRSICAGDRADTQDGTRLSYQGCVFHRVIKDFAVIGGDIARHDGTGRASIYGGHFADENFVLRHTGPGVLTCCNAGPDTNSSAFMITTVEAPWLNGRSVAFGCLANAESFDALEKLEACGVEGGRPSVYIQITACGQLFPPQEKPPATKPLASRRRR